VEIRRSNWGDSVRRLPGEDSVHNKSQVTLIELCVVLRHALIGHGLFFYSAAAGDLPPVVGHREALGVVSEARLRGTGVVCLAIPNSILTSRGSVRGVWGSTGVCIKA